MNKLLSSTGFAGLLKSPRGTAGSAGLGALRNWAAALALATMAGAAPAALVLQANNLEVLDTDTNLLWLYVWQDEQNNPLKTWAEGNAWAAALTVGGAAAGDWRTPLLSEFDDLWVDPAVGQSINGLRNHFINVTGVSSYWTGNSDAQNDTIAWVFLPANGLSFTINKGSNLYTTAVRSAATGPGPRAVPEPQSAALALLGLGVVVLHSRRRRPGAVRVGANKLPSTARA